MPFPVKNLRVKPTHMRSWNALQFSFAHSSSGNGTPGSKLHASIEPTPSNTCCFLGSGAGAEEEEDGLEIGNSKHKSEF